MCANIAKIAKVNLFCILRKQRNQEGPRNVRKYRKYRKNRKNKFILYTQKTKKSRRAPKCPQISQISQKSQKVTRIFLASLKVDNHVTSQHGGHFNSWEFSYSPFFIRDFVRSYSVKTRQVPMVLFGKAKELHMFQNGRCVSSVLK